MYFHVNVILAKLQDLLKAAKFGAGCMAIYVQKLSNLHRDEESVLQDHFRRLLQ